MQRLALALVCAAAAIGLASPGASAQVGGSFQQAVINFCNARAISGCHYWPMNETSGTVMHDVIGTLNGTYSSDVTSGGTFDTGEPMGMPDGSVGIDMWQFGSALVTPLPTPAAPQFTEGVVVRDCDVQKVTGTGDAGPYLFDSLGPNTAANKGQAIFVYNSQLQTIWGTGSGYVSGGLIGSYYPTCEPKLLIIASYDPSGTQDGYFMVNNVPNTDGFTGPASPDLLVNAYYQSGSYHAYGKGDVYCCMFYIPASLATEDLLPIQAAFGR